MSAATATLSLQELDRDSSVLEAAAKQVGFALAQGSLIAIVGVGCYYLHRAHKTAAKLRKALNGLEVETTEDRAILKDIAVNLGQATSALEKGFEEIQKLGISQVPVFGHRYVTMLEDLAIAAEDMSETAALTANAAFCREVRTQFHKNIDEHQRTVRTA